MAFSFGNTGQSAFGSTQAKPTFGTSAFGTPTSTTNTGFGFGSTFGQPQQPAFGQTQQPPTFGGFGQTAASAAPAFGTTFGAPAQQTVSSFGTSFGAPASTAPPSFGTTGSAFGTTPGLFGSTATTKPTLFGTPSTTGPTLFSTPATTSSLFGTGTATTTTPNLFGNVGSTPGLFGTATATTSTPSLFGTSFGTTAASTGGGLFGTTPSTTTGFNLFGGTTTTTPSLFGNSFGMGSTQLSTGGFSFGLGTSAAPSFGGFGTTTTPSLFGTGMTNSFAQPKPPTPQPTQQHINNLVSQSIYFINIFNDERDDILKKWNMLQACWGVGKGYYNANQPPVEYTQYNPFYRLKAVGYNVIPEYENMNGLVRLVFNKKYAELSSQKQAIINGITGILGNKPNLKVSLESMRAMSDVETEVKIVVSEKGVTGTSRNIPATELGNFLNQPTQKQQLMNVGVTKIVPLTTPTKAMLEEYLKTVPPGFDEHMWKAAISDNPNPSKLIPVPIFGFGDLKARKMMQDHETGLHKAYQAQISKELEELKKRHASAIARMNEFRQRFVQLEHRTLKILVLQESVRKAGLTLSADEEYLRGKLETIYTQLSAPAEYKHKLKELISMMKIFEKDEAPRQPEYKLIPEAQKDLKVFLGLQQNAIAKLIDIVKEDMQDLDVIIEDTKKFKT